MYDKDSVPVELDVATSRVKDPENRKQSVIQALPHVSQKTIHTVSSHTPSTPRVTDDSQSTYSRSTVLQHRMASPPGLGATCLMTMSSTSSKAGCASALVSARPDMVVKADLLKNFYAAWKKLPGTVFTTDRWPSHLSAREVVALVKRYRGVSEEFYTTTQFSCP